MSDPARIAATTQPPGVRPLADYALVIDARTPHEYAEDHIPGALNLPVVDDAEFAEVGTLHRDSPHQAYLLGAQYSLRNIARHIGEVIAPLGPRQRLLVYCFRGGKRSRAWAEPLRGIGYLVDVLPGGWKAYRAWVRAELDRLPAGFAWRVVAGVTGSGKTRLLQALREAGEQVVDLEDLACHRGSLLGDLPGEQQPSQKSFDSVLRAELALLDPARPVWVESESKKIGRLQLPDALYDAMRRAPAWDVQAALALRLQICREDYAHYLVDPQALLKSLAPLKPLVGAALLAEWERLAVAGEMDALIASLIERHYDPCYRRSLPRDRELKPLHLTGIDAAGLAAAVAELTRG